MNDPIVIGVDVGGTNTDAVVFRLGSRSVLAAAKSPSTPDFGTGVANAIRDCLLTKTHKLNNDDDDDDIAAVFLGTTAFVNALLEGRGLARTAVVRLCGPSARALAPLQDFPEQLKDLVCVGTWFAAGGLYFDGKREELPLDKEELIVIAKEISSATPKVEAVVVSGAFSPSNNEQEVRAAEILGQYLSSDIIRISISSKSGRLGLLSRENAAVLDACLFRTAQRAASSARRALKDAGVPDSARLFFTTNDGSVLPLHQVPESPLRCIACGPTNSLRGAAFLTHSEIQKDDKDSMDRIVLDVGGTSTDAGCLVRGSHPRRANSEARIAGVTCNQRTTDVVSIALGGGSIISSTDGTTITVGPESVGAEITEKALCFGGTVCTATCIAVAMGADMSSTPHVGSGETPSRDFVVPSFAATAWEAMQTKFYQLVEQTRTDASPIEVLVVGGAAGLVDSVRLSRALGGCRVRRPQEWASVANACGSALGQAAGEIEAIANLSKDREAILDNLKGKACTAAGADAKVVECEEVPLAYLPGKVSRIHIRAVASLELSLQPSSVEEEFVEHLDIPTERPPALRRPDPPPISPSPPNVKDGEWTVSEYDAHCLAIGSGILGCGGGGSTRHGLLQLLAALKNGQHIRIVSAKDISDTALVAPCAFMGAPTVSLEMIGNPDCLLAAVNQNLKMKSQNGDNNDDEASVFIMLSEVGGDNGLQPLLVGGLTNRPVVDADLMGRAFPELQMTTTAIYGLPQTPITASDAFGQCVCLATPLDSNAHDLTWAERVLRPVCVEFGCSAGLCDPILSGADVRRVAVLGSVSRARRIGDCILRARLPAEAIEKLLEQEGGRLLFQGKVSDVQRETSAGFAKGNLTILGDDNVTSVEIEFQNEFLVARESKGDGPAKMIGCVPDLISLIDADSARPIATEEVRYGFRVMLLLLPVPCLLRSPEALQVVGPSAFDLEETYESMLDGDWDMRGLSIADS